MLLPDTLHPACRAGKLSPNTMTRARSGQGQRRKHSGLERMRSARGSRDRRWCRKSSSDANVGGLQTRCLSLPLACSSRFSRTECPVRRILPSTVRALTINLHLEPISLEFLVARLITQTHQLGPGPRRTNRATQVLLSERRAITQCLRNCVIEGEWQSLSIAAALQQRIRKDTISSHGRSGCFESSTALARGSSLPCQNWISRTPRFIEVVTQLPKPGQ
jgi:hypothetical protein